MDDGEWGKSVGLELEGEDLKRARVIIEGYRTRLEALRALNLESEQLPAEQTFPADWETKS